MSSSPSSLSVPADRNQRIRQVVGDVLRQRSAGSPVGDAQIVAQHADLLPELADELAKLQRIEYALGQADEKRCRYALARLEFDWARDRAAEQQSGQSACPDGAAGAERDSPRDDSTIVADQPGGSGTAHLPTHIGRRYQVVRLLGEGGFGRVYEAWDEELARHVAVKVPHRHRLSAAADVEVYLSEARLLAALDHPAIVPVYDFDRTAAGGCFLVSKLIRGTDLASWMKQSRPSHEDAARIVMCVAQALHYAHLGGIVHRDIKPANILLDSQARPYVTDFGLALKDAALGDGLNRAGTPAYMSPEQARGEAHRVDGRSDVFSLGVVLYELLTGWKPFPGEGHEQLLEQILWAEPRPLRQLDAAIDAELERICLKALAKRAADRYPTAAHLVDDLQHYMRLRRAPAAAPAAPRAAVEQHSLGRPRSQIVPKGLRAFDANDADYFLELLPGPRDRDQVPESIRQWKIRVEQSDGAETFAVGLLYGPSGCGKSSLVRAGLLPRLAPHVRSLYVEAAPEETETRLLQRLVKQFPQFSSETDLAGCLARLRRGDDLPPGHKLLLVIDQFEQWLHGRSEESQRELVRALRQCDGERLQCLLLVRDDFWLAVSRFMAELEVDLVQGHNTALVDLFDAQHARKVLAEFGRAYGQLPGNLAELTGPQNAFLDRAVAGLCECERVVPVRLALFAEMVKSRPWTPATLREIGGAAGVGVTFLEETFTARTANPQNRAHQRAARAVLEALLPDAGSNIKGQIRSYFELLDVSGYGNNPRAFRELMRILDSETRLLTPTDAEPTGMTQTGPAAAARFYQLTHDYLVPSLRDWLTRKQKTTTAGRMELRLADRAQMWTARPERRQLPSLWEWIAIRLFTRPMQWSLPQRKMMRAAGRHHAVSWGAVVLLSLIFLLVGTELTALAKSALMQLRARTSMVWLALGQDEAIWPILKHDADPTLRTRLIHQFSPLVVTPEQLVEQLPQHEDLSVRRAMLLIVGELAGDPEKRPSRSLALQRSEPPAEHIRQLGHIYQNDPDPGVHAAAEWVLRRYQRDDELARVRYARIESGFQGMRQWMVTPQGHTMVIIPGPTEYLMGSPKTAGQRRDDEPLHSRRLARSYSIAGHETTVAQFERFLRDHPEMGWHAPRRFAGTMEVPQTAVTWYQAVAYCNWLSERENIPQDQWCYLPNADGMYAAGMRIKPDAEKLSGYRLPTEGEWEFACRAGAATPRYFGRTDVYLQQYAVCAGSNYAGGPLPVGQRKPNDFGLFDMLGNVQEWCQDRYRSDPTAAGSDLARPLVEDHAPRVLRGGSFQDPAAQIRCAARDHARPSAQETRVGFRVARSYRD